MQIVTREQMRRIESEADARGLTYAEMMRRAGEAVARAVHLELGGSGTVVVLAGPGNNGGDALVAAAELDELGYNVHVYLWHREMDGDELVGELARRDAAIVRARDDKRFETLTEWLEDADGVVDGLLGLGVDRPIEADLGKLLSHAHDVLEYDSPAIVVAVDVPTGLNPDDGSVDPHTLAADVTVTFGFPKAGLYTFPGATFVGELVHDSLGIPDDAPEGELFMLTPDEVTAKLPDRPLDGHKGTFGSVLVVGGSANYTGAPYFAAVAAYRSGCGLVTIGLPGSIHRVVAALAPEATYLLLPEDLGVVSKGAAHLLREAWGKYEVLLLGPGLTDERPAAEFLETLLSDEEEGASAEPPARIGFRLSAVTAVGARAPAVPAAEAPAKAGRRKAAKPKAEEDAQPATAPPKPAPRWVVDADALTLVAKLEGGPKRLPVGSVITPHPGEMGRLLGITADEVNADRVAIARKAAAEWGHVVVLKGAFTVIAHPDGRTCINPFATTALAKAGTGDLLAGLIAGFLAQGLDPFEAATVGAYVHGLAGEHADDDVGARAATVLDVLDALPAAMMAMEEEV